MSVISRELMTLYEAKKNDVLPQLSTLTIQYKDYVAWQAKEMQSTAFQDHKAYWKGQLLAPLSYLQLPTDYSTSLKATTTKSAYYSITISKNTKHTIEQLAKCNAVSVFSVFMTAFKILLFRLTGEKDCSVGIPAANRNHDQLKNVVGSFLNTVIHRNEITPETSVTDFLKDVNTNLLEGLEHQNYPFEKVLEDSNIASNQHSFPISPVFLNLLDFDASTLILGLFAGV